MDVTDTNDGIVDRRDEIIDEGVLADVFSEDEIPRCIGPGISTS